MLGLLDALGGDCAGAITLLPEGEPFSAATGDGPGNLMPAALNAAELDDRLRRAPDDPFAASSAGEYRLSLAGAQAKLPVIWAARDQGAALPRSPTTPTTHILKPGSAVIPDLVSNEFFCMRLATAVGLNTAKVEADETATGLPYLRVERYDRTTGVTPAGRLHQEDLCQALGIISEQKYENEGGPSLAAIADLLRTTSATPAGDLLALWSAVVFNVLIGNCDTHGKNFSILWTSSGLRLAPLYDLVSTAVYTAPRLDPPLTQRLAMRIGPARRLFEVDRPALERLAERLDLRPGAMLRRADTLTRRTIEAATRLAGQAEHNAPIVQAIIDGIESRAARLSGS